MMNEEEILKKLNFMLWQYSKPPQNTTGCTNFEERCAIQEIIDLYQKEKEKNKQLELEIDKINEEKELYKFSGQNAFINTFINSNYISKDKIKELQGKLCMKLGSYVRNESTPEQERVAGAINILNELLKD